MDILTVFRFLVTALMLLGINLGIVYIYRRKPPVPERNRVLLIVSPIAGVVSVYIWFVLLSLPYKTPAALLIAVVGGAPIGLQAARVMIRIREDEMAR